jgi:hypothetical protein
LFAYNAGFGLSGGIPGFFLAAPDTERSVSPELSFFVLITAVLMAALFVKRRLGRRQPQPES